MRKFHFLGASLGRFLKDLYWIVGAEEEIGEHLVPFDRLTVGRLMDNLDIEIDRWKQSLCPEVSVDGLFARNSVVHKWKAPHRVFADLPRRVCNPI